MSALCALFKKIVGITDEEDTKEDWNMKLKKTESFWRLIKLFGIKFNG